MPEGRRPLGRPRHRWVDNIKMDLEEIVWGDVDLIQLSQNSYKCRALANAEMSFRFLKMLGNYRVATQLVASRVVLRSIE
jgi:hypothetical protein